MKSHHTFTNVFLLIWQIAETKYLETIDTVLFAKSFFSYPFISVKLDAAKFNFAMCLNNSALFRENLMFLHVNKRTYQPLQTNSMFHAFGFGLLISKQGVIT